MLLNLHVHAAASKTQPLENCSLGYQGRAKFHKRKDDGYYLLKINSLDIPANLAMVHFTVHITGLSTRFYIRCKDLPLYFVILLGKMNYSNTIKSMHTSCFTLVHCTKCTGQPRIVSLLYVQTDPRLWYRLTQGCGPGYTRGTVHVEI